MAPNRNLSDILVTGRPSHSDYNVLTPRTPHSRAGRAEQGFTQAELQAYWVNLAIKWDLYSHTIFNTKVVEAVWNVAEQKYDIEVENVQSGKKGRTCAQVIVSATGILLEPVLPSDMKGIHFFKGEMFHSGHWNHSIDLRNKRVGVIGNGCSA